MASQFQATMPHKPHCRCRPCLYKRGEGPPETPIFTVRLPHDVQEYVRSRAEGARAYLEALIREDMARQADGAKE